MAKFVSRKCPVCRHIFKIKASRIAHGRGKTCSYKCRAISIRTHGDSSEGYLTPEYRAWASIKTRCLNPNDSHYKNYGGRGITICEEWANSFEAFLADVGRRPSKKHSIDRINNTTGHYEPGNVRWATPKEQAYNRRTNRLITFGNETHCISEWAEITGISYNALLKRLDAGWSEKRALTQPQKRQRRV